jgi:phage replication O-like protein O
MARPQIENGHCDIATELLEAIIKAHFSNTEHAVFWAIVRKTYGWHKKIDRISFSQLEELTGINRRHIAPALKGLIKRNMVIRQGEKQNLEYGVQKDYELWQPLPISVTATITETGNETITDISNAPLPISVTVDIPKPLPISVQPLPISVKTVTENRTKPLPISVHTKDNTKDNTNTTIQKKDYAHAHAREELPDKKNYGEFLNVLLTEQEYEKLKQKVGRPRADDLIEQLSSYMRQNPANAKKYVDHYATILNWARKDGRKDGAHKGYSGQPRKPEDYTDPEEYRKRAGW